MATTDSGAKRVTAPKAANEDSLAGVLYALVAYLLWGGLPIYLKLVAHIPPLEVVAHRVLWSLPIAAVVLLLRGRMGDVGELLRQPKKIGMALITAGFVTVNWLVYVYAIGSGHALEAALGYYINPLISIVIAAIFLGERIDGMKRVAVALAAVAVAVLAYDAGGLPWISLVLAFSWGFYAFFKKSLPLGPNQGFFLEVMLLSLPATGYIVYLEIKGVGHIGHGDGIHDIGLLMFGGIATAAPLMIYANGAKLLRLSTIAIMQYIAPTIVFCMAIFLFHEPFNNTKLLASTFIWLALIIYTVSLLRQRRN
jgi:chloramphenicol-sensitive protein RarD